MFIISICRLAALILAEFENVGAGKEAEAVAAHFNPDSSQIMGVQILDN